MAIVHSHALLMLGVVYRIPLYLRALAVKGETLKPRWVRLLIVPVYNNNYIFLFDFPHFLIPRGNRFRTSVWSAKFEKPMFLIFKQPRKSLYVVGDPIRTLKSASLCRISIPWYCCPRIQWFCSPGKCRFAAKRIVNTQIKHQHA